MNTETLPDCAALALLVTGLVQRLGGFMVIDATGKRNIGWPESPSLVLPNGIPQMPDAQPWERFSIDAEWDGARKLAAYLLHRLSARDKELAFTIAAPVSVDHDAAFDFRDLLK